MLRAVIYCRCSTEEEAQQDALIQQVRESREIVRQQGWVLVDEYIELKSGTTTAKRNEYNRLYEDLQADKFDIVQIKTQDRLMRNTKDWYLFVDRLVSNGKRLYMYLEHKFYTPDDALITGIKAILAEEFSKELSKKINNAHYHRQREGGTLILPPQTYGLKKNPNGEIVLVEEEVEAIRVMFYLCKTMGCNSIEHYLEEHGFRDRNGRPFKAEAIRRIIRNPIRCGTVIQNQRHFDFQTKKMIRVPESEWVIHENAVPAAVSEREWREANAAMDSRAAKGNLTSYCPRGQGKYPGKYQLSGKIRCGECGSPFYRRYRKVNAEGMLVVEWKCQRYLQNGRNQKSKRKENLRKTELSPGNGCDNIHLEEEKLFQLLEKVCGRYYQKMELDYSGIVEKTISILNEVLNRNDSESQAKKIQKELEKYEIQKKKLLDKLLEDVISDQDYKKKQVEIDAKVKSLAEKREKLRDSENARLVVERRLQAIRKRLEDGAVNQATLSEMIDSIEVITVYPEKLLLTFKADKMLGMEQQLLNSVEEIAGSMKEGFTYEVPLGEDFSYAARKEAECQRIITYIRENPTITAKQIAQKEQISLSAANARLRKIKRKNKIYFEGRGGHGQWIVCEEKPDRELT